MASESDPYIFTTDTLPRDPRFLPPLANGLLGWRVYHNIMHMGSVYNGEGGDCHRADIPCPLSVTMEMEEPVQQSYSLNTHTGEPHTAVTSKPYLYDPAMFELICSFHLTIIIFKE